MPRAVLLQRRQEPARSCARGLLSHCLQNKTNPNVQSHIRICGGGSEGRRYVPTSLAAAQLLWRITNLNSAASVQVELKPGGIERVQGGLGGSRGHVYVRSERECARA
jgi:hypothetical protein